MKPVYIEETIAKLRDIIDSVMKGSDPLKEVNRIAGEIEQSLKSYKDNKENKALFYGASILIVLLSAILIYKTRSSWPLMFVVIWLGGFLWYRVHERGLILDNIEKISKVKPEEPLSNLVYLKSAIDLKVGRKQVLKIFLSVMISSTVMMAHYLFVDTSFWMNLGLLSAAIIASYFFWQSFYKEDITALQLMKDQLQQLENQIIIGTGHQTEEE